MKSVNMRIDASSNITCRSLLFRDANPSKPPPSDPPVSSSFIKSAMSRKVKQGISTRKTLDILIRAGQ